MASEIRVNTFKNRSGLGTVSINDTGASFSGVVTATSGFSGDLTGNVAGNVTGNVTGNITGNLTGDVTGNVNAGVVTATSSIVVGNKFINSSGIGLGTTDTTGRNAGVGTAVGTLIYNTTTNAVEGYGPTGWVNVKSLEAFNATGGTTVENSGYKYHIFTTGPSSLVVSSGSASADILVVGGGGGGGRQHGGGGGGGSVVHATSAPLTPGTYPVSIGAAGAPGGPQPGPWTDVGGTPGGQGGTSTFGSSPLPVNISALGGGGGSAYGANGGNATNGGSGGGGSAGPPGGVQGTGTAPPTSPASAATSDAGGKSYQNNGGTKPGSNPEGGAGGGGAGAAGNQGTPTLAYGGDGGAGQPVQAFPGPIFTPMPSPWQSAVGPTGLFGGGGGGASHINDPTSGGAGGPGGGGAGGNYFTPPEASSGDGDPGVDNTGGGGGGGGSNDVGASAGGTGVVIVRYAV